MKNKFAKIARIVTATAVMIGVGFSSFATVKAGEDNYTYTYDYWGDVQDSPDTYTVAQVFDFGALGLDKNLKAPESLYVHENHVFLCDTGNNRIIEFERSGSDALTYVREITKISGAEPETFNGPADIAISENGDFFIADRENNRVIRTDKDLNYIMSFTRPSDQAIDKEMGFRPDKLVADSAGRIYVEASGINKGLLKFENDGTFSGFVGATRVSYNFLDYMWKRFASQEQRAQMVSFVPTEYDNVYLDKEGFIYAVAGGLKEEDLDAEKVDAVRKLNMMGTDILVRNGEWPVYGDLYWGGGGGITGPSYFKDVTVLDNDIYVCLDQNRGRLFGYDDQGRMVYAFGGNGNQAGYFRKPVSIEHMDYDLLVLDQLDGTITLFIPTHYGQTIYDAMAHFEVGEYDEAQACWEEVKMLNGNYDLAYIGIGRSLLRKEQYRESMDYFEVKYDDENYSRAYAQYRKQWIRENIIGILVIILCLFLVPMSISKVYSLKEEIDNADIFKLRNRQRNNNQ
ncbi:MAG: hypothetical protein K6B44_02950 [Lachnospiraceae bacterium]|nr:hypothetical protein [Lachnospiraceae bacterium]